MRLSLSSIAGSIGILLVAIVLSVSCRPDVPDVGPDVGPVIPEGAVDMGIVMTREDGSTYKLYWAETNLCEIGLCQRPEDLGDYYAWEETQPYYEAGHSQDNPCTDWKSGKNGYYWNSYKWCNGDNYKLTRYCPMERRAIGTAAENRTIKLNSGIMTMQMMPHVPFLRANGVYLPVQNGPLFVSNAPGIGSM